MHNRAHQLHVHLQMRVTSLNQESSLQVVLGHEVDAGRVSQNVLGGLRTYFWVLPERFEDRTRQQKKRQNDKEDY